MLGASVSASGLSLLFPFEIPMFAKTFAILNDTGLPQAFGLGTLQTEMSPQQEMQLAQAWHAIVSFVMMAMIIAHIYIGSLVWKVLTALWVMERSTRNGPISITQFGMMR